MQTALSSAGITAHCKITAAASTPAAGNCAVFLHADGTLSLLGEGDRSIASAESWTGLPVPAGS